mmetsp:Transcript_7258/g.10796  ORF Transcript_7258/g.10796 Transcript_7258/m.10796 type:complete len:101 (+) Transcript_7258:90-392(+)
MNSASVGNPLSTIQTRLQNLRSERELVESEISSLLLEKNAIQKIIPKILYELTMMKEGIDSKQREINIYDKAILEIEEKYGHIIFSEDFFVGEDQESTYN